MATSTSYILRGNDASELKRLAIQHEVWSHETQRLYERSGLMEADRIMELGCGPGYSVLDLAKGKASEVWGVDSSIMFIEHLETLATKYNHQNVMARCGDVHEISFEKDYFDAFYCRWFLMFIPGIKTLVDKIFNALKPGGVFVAMEYGPFLDISLKPDSAIFNKVYRSVYELLKRKGGNPDIGTALPALLKATGFSGVEVEEISKSDTAGSDLWKWIETVGTNHHNLVENGLISHDELNEYYDTMQEYGKMGSAQFRAPTVKQIIAYR